jgi:hypothetical protein
MISAADEEQATAVMDEVASQNGDETKSQLSNQSITTTKELTDIAGKGGSQEQHLLQRTTKQQERYSKQQCDDRKRQVRARNTCV